MPVPEQSWQETLKPIVDRWKLCAKMNLEWVETPQGCAALVEIVEKMATIIDNEIDRRKSK